MDIEFRNATKKDVPLILRFIKELAEYEGMAKEVITDEDTLERSLFGKHPYAEVIFAITDGSETGFVLFFHNFSTFLGKPGIYIEDLYVSPGYRNKGIGKALLRHVAGLAAERDCGRVEWWVLNWNPARKFYDALGAKAMSEWIVYRLDEKSYKKLSGYD
jgi:GNAT superfamily N-acetyltransferase